MMMRISVLRNCFVSFLAAVVCFACVAAAGAPVKWPKLPTPPAPPKAPEPPKPYFPPSRPLTPIEMEQAERAKKAALEGLKTNLVVPEKAPEQDSLEKLIEKLLNEFGPDGRYGITSHFIVIYDTTDSYAMWCATLMENVTSTYEKFVSSTKLVEDGLADPMVVFIFADENDYRAYLQKNSSQEFQKASPDVVGFYSSGSNRAVFFDPTGKEQNKPNKGDERTIEQVATEVLADPRGAENISTVVHEGTHQVSYNYGLFSRKGENPKWAIEGLAMLFEAPGGEPKDGGWKIVDEKAKTIKFPINERRVREFQQYVATSTDAQPIKKVVGMEVIGSEEPCSYPVSWALFYYLYRYYPKVLAQYLIDNAAVQPRLTFTSRQRVYEFANYFGEDWDGMWMELRAFVDALELELKGVDPLEADKRARAKYNLAERVVGKRNARKGAVEKKTGAEAQKKAADANGAEPKTESLPSESEKTTEAAKSAEKPGAGVEESAKKKSESSDDWFKNWSKEQ